MCNDPSSHPNAMLQPLMPLNIVPPPIVVTHLASVQISLDSMLSSIVFVVSPQVTIDVFVLGGTSVATVFDRAFPTLRMVVHVFTRAC